MLPVLFSIGSFNFYSLGLFLGLGYFLTAFFIWRRLRDLGINEEKVIDLIIAATIFGLIFARIFFLIQNISSFGLNLSHWLLIIRYPGLSLGGIGAVFLVVYWFSRRQNLDFWQLADEFSYGLLPLLILVQIGAFFDGSGFGKPTILPWGVYAAGSLVKRHPLPLMMALGFFIAWIFLLRIERNWRAWRWYKSKAHGLIALSFGALTMGFNFLIAFLKDNLLYWYWLEIGLSLALVGLFLGIIYFRSGRRQSDEKEKKKKRKKIKKQK